MSVSHHTQILQPVKSTYPLSHAECPESQSGVYVNEVLSEILHSSSPRQVWPVQAALLPSHARH